MLRPPRERPIACLCSPFFRPLRSGAPVLEGLAALGYEVSDMQADVTFDSFLLIVVVSVVIYFLPALVAQVADITSLRAKRCRQGSSSGMMFVERQPFADPNAAAVRRSYVTVNVPSGSTTSRYARIKIPMPKKNMSKAAIT